MENSNTGARQLFTEAQAGTTLLALNADSTTASNLQTDLDAANASEAECLLKYARGYDVTDITSCNSPGIRSWLMGDALHSRPLAINYGGSSSTNPDIRLLVGGNDGYMRMYRNTTSNGAESGEEIWAFMPREVMPILKDLIDNNAATYHKYGVDGASSAYILDENGDGTISGNDKVWLYFGLRRGGRAYYALDITNPDSPSLLWSINSSDSDFSELGYTFAQPVVALIDWGHADGEKPVVIFPGGYDLNKDNSGTGTDDSVGNALYIVDAETGALVWKAVNSGASSTTVHVVNTIPDLVDSIASNITVLDSNNDTLADRIYVGSTGGIVWRVDLAGDDRNDWSMNPVLNVGRHSTSGIDRRFFHAPDVSFTADEDDNDRFDAVAIGTGDRPNPLDQTVANQFYMLKDRFTSVYLPDPSNPNPPTLIDGSALTDLTDNCLQDADVSCPTSLNLDLGWRIDLEESGEKNLASPLILGGSIIFTTYIPPSGTSNQCGAEEGNGAIYGIRLQDATAVSNRVVANDNDGGGELQKEDRVEWLNSGGIPSEVVVLAINDLPINSVPILRPDLNVEYVDTRLHWKTFWHQDSD